MNKSFFNIFILLTLTLTSLYGVGKEIHIDSDNQYHISKTEKMVEAHYEVDHDCDDCDVNGCSEPGECCSGACICLTSFMMKTRDKNLKSHIFDRTIVSWFYYHKYNSPSLDPALKPPLNS